MRFTRNDILPTTVLLSCAAICSIVTLARSKQSIEPILWYGPMPHPYITEVSAGVDASMNGLSSPVYKMVGQEWSQGNETSNIEALSTKGHRGFSIYPVDPAGANGLFAHLRSRDQWVIAYGAEPALPTPAMFTVATNVEAAAETATEELIRRMGNRGQILNVLEAMTDINTQKRNAGILKAVARYPNVSIAQTIGDMAQVSEATDKIQNAMAARAGDIDGIIATGYTPTVAAASLLREWHKDPNRKRIRFVGIDTDTTVLTAIRENAIDATIAQNTYAHGAIPVIILDLLLQGWSPKQPYQFIDSGIVIVDKTNVDSYADSIRELTDQVLADVKQQYLDPPNK